jgi:hypothetical protein
MTERQIKSVALVVALACAAVVSVELVRAGAQGQVPAREGTLYVSAVDGKGEPVQGLGVSDFVVREDGTRREVLRVSRAVDPIDIAFLIDNGSTSEDAISHVRLGLTRFVSAMSRQNSIAIVGLADRPTILTDYTMEPARLNQGIGRLFTQSASGVTLLDALVEVSRGLERRETARAVIVPVITDGVEYSNRNYRDVLEALDRAGVGLHTFAIGVFDFSSDDPIRNRAFVLDEGTRTSGGQHVTLLTASAVPRALEKLSRELSSQYKVVYGRPESLIAPEKARVESARIGVTMRGTPARGQNGA